MSADDNVGFLLVQLCRAHRQQIDIALNRIGLHVGQEHVVYQLSIQDGVPQGQLAQRLFIDVSTATKMLLRLERAGVIERRADPEDARVSRVYLTAHGRALVQPVVDIWQAIEARLLQNMTAAEQVLIRRLLLQLLHNFS